MSNPVLNEKFIDRTGVMGEPLTMNGVLQKTFILFAIMVISAGFIWTKGLEGHGDLVTALTAGGALIGFILAMIICFTRKMVLTPLYAVAEGLFIGGLSFIMEKVYPGIVQTAVLGTIMTVAAMLLLYSTKLIKVNDKFTSVLMTATIAIAGIYLVQFIGSFFGLSIPGLFSNGTVGIVFSLFVIGIAALNLILDFHFIENAAQSLVPKEYEWFFGFSLMVTVVWVYVEILRLASKLQSRD